MAEKNVPLMVNENWRWQPWYRKMKSIIEEGELGNLYYANFVMRPGDGWGDTPYSVQPYFKTMDKFLMFETGIHFIDTFRYLFGNNEAEEEYEYTVPEGYKGGSAIATQQHFINCLISGESFEASGQQYITNMRILFSCYDSMDNTK